MDADRGGLPAPALHHLKTPMSFSMSSLQQAGCHTPETTAVRLRADRPYNSLCRKRKECSADTSHRQSWGSEVSKDAFWEALQPSYAFLMEDQLIESCKEANGDLTWDATDVPGMDSTWSFDEFMDQYNELYQWLNEIQVVIYSSPKNITDRRLRESHMEEIQRKSYRRTLLAEQSVRLQRRQPELRDEVAWRLAHLSNKWDTLLRCVRPPSPSEHASDPDMAGIGPDIAHEVRCLEQWFRHMDGQLGPISFRIDLRSTQEAAEKLKQYQALHDEIKSHHRIVSGVCRLCNQLSEGGARRRLARVADRLDTSWQQIFLRAYEWTCHLEGLLDQFKQGHLPRVEDGYSADEDEREPQSKVRRLGSWDDPASAHSIHSDAGSFFEDDYLPSISGMKVLQASNGSGPTTPAKRVEREVLDIGYSSENSGQSSDSSEAADVSPGAESTASAPGRLASGVRRAAVNASNVRCEVINADLNGNGSDAPAASDGRHGDAPAPAPGGSGGAGGVPGGRADGAEPFSVSQRPAENCGTFYFRHSDTESEGARRRLRYEPASSDLEYASPAWPDTDSDWLNNSGLDDSELEQIGFATAQELLSELGEHEEEAGGGAAAEPGPPATRPPAPPCDSEIHRLVERAESLVRADLRRSLPPLELHRQVKAKGRRVREWLRRQHGRRPCEPAAAAAPPDVSGQVTDSSCDASGEYTTGESDAETASSASEDLTCSMVTCHELATPTNAPAPGGSPDGATPKVVLRSKKRRSGERPWSLHGLTSAGRPRAAPLSVSETALNEMVTPTAEKGVTSSSSNTTVSAGAIPKRLPSSVSFDSPFWSGRRRSRPLRPTAAHSSGSEASLLSCATEATLVEVSPRTASEGSSPRHGGPPQADEVGSFSEQAWDPYQELKEVTEVGSEGSVDRDAVLRLLDCDDYRKYIDSHSDCASSQVSSARGPPRSPLKRSRRKPRALSDSLDSDSDGDGVQAILAESCRNLAVVQTELERRAADSDATYSSIVATCRSELNRLEQVRTLVDPLGLGADPASPCYKPEVADVADRVVVEVKDVVEVFEDSRMVERTERTLTNTVDLSPVVGPALTQTVIQRWEALRTAAMERQRSADALGGLRERIRTFRLALADLDERTNHAMAKVASDDDLQARISAIKLVTINTDVHGHVTGGGGDPSLKDDIATLYRIWDEVNHRSRAQLEQLTALEATWHAFRAARAELAAVLQADKQKLGLLREALLTGGDVGSRVQDVARSAEQLAEQLAAAADDLSEGTSGYDSACSDDLSERERRLGRLRRMARDLEAVVSPASPAWDDIEHTLTSAASELRELQQSCRELVIKTTAQFQADTGPSGGSPLLRGPTVSPHPPPPVQDMLGLHTQRAEALGVWGSSWLGLMFGRLALMLCFCVACLLEPHCCDHLNNLSMSLTPQLRYMRGPPPI
ncbi:uncharacterized protein LOC119094294 [Pollicipes pollicipes]|uniref:uncharacterized protein LOC119094294 n=1 Tax=Pollicipes pollicipes TaxID=41117 RepID=UPI001885487A|nr:uncharacterized protein LOC119094294 [Pollicipes pollicipes]